MNDTEKRIEQIVMEHESGLGLSSPECLREDIKALVAAAKEETLQRVADEWVKAFSEEDTFVGVNKNFDKRLATLWEDLRENREQVAQGGVQVDEKGNCALCGMPEDMRDADHWKKGNHPRKAI